MAIHNTTVHKTHRTKSFSYLETSSLSKIYTVWKQPWQRNWHPGAMYNSWCSLGPFPPQNGMPQCNTVWKNGSSTLRNGDQLSTCNMKEEGRKGSVKGQRDGPKSFCVWHEYLSALRERGMSLLTCLVHCNMRDATPWCKREILEGESQ